MIKVHDCIVGLHFDAARGYCDFPKEANCKVDDVEDNQQDEDSDESMFVYIGD